MWVRSALLPTLSGRWSLDRSVENSLSGEPMATMRGTALFAAEAEGEAVYSESVTVTLEGGVSMPATQHYFYRQEADVLAIYFDDTRQRLFHRLAPAAKGLNLVARSFHYCAPDSYDSQYEFRDDGRLAVVHAVSGPRKSYVSRTLYVRQA